MIKITDALAVEHALLLAVFEQIESLLPEITTTEEAARLARLVKGLLSKHADTEDNLVYVTLDHALENQGKLKQLHQEHQEIDDRFDKVSSACGISEARRLLKMALQASRDHFASEEHFIFPVLEKFLQNETLTEMGNAWAQKQMAF